MSKFKSIWGLIAALTSILSVFMAWTIIFWPEVQTEIQPEPPSARQLYHNDVVSRLMPGTSPTGLMAIFSVPLGVVARIGIQGVPSAFMQTAQGAGGWWFKMGQAYHVETVELTTNFPNHPNIVYSGCAKAIEVREGKLICCASGSVQLNEADQEVDPDMWVRLHLTAHEGHSLFWFPAVPPDIPWADYTYTWAYSYNQQHSLHELPNIGPYSKVGIYTNTMILTPPLGDDKIYETWCAPCGHLYCNGWTCSASGSDSNGGARHFTNLSAMMSMVLYLDIDIYLKAGITPTQSSYAFASAQVTRDIFPTVSDH